MPDWIGKTIGRVRIEKYLARGGMAEVYLGSHLTLERPVAVKVLHSYIEEDPDLLNRFQREAKVVAGLRHPNIVQVFDFDTVDGHPYIVMEYLSGPTLATYLRNLHEQNQRIPTHQVARLLKGLTSALDYAHELGVIHRDIKPGNILLHSKSGEIPIDQPLTKDIDAILTDFGLVRITNSASQTATGRISGTPSYMAPEQARGDKTDHRTDIYSLGVVLYELLAGRVPFESDSTLSIIYKHINEPPPHIPGIAPAVQNVIDRALVKDPNGRYQSSRDMAVDFFLAIGMTAQAETVYESILKFQEPAPPPVPAPVPAPMPVEQPKSPRSKMWLGAGIFSFICLLGMAVGAFIFRSSILGNPGDLPTSVAQSTEANPPEEVATSTETSELPVREKMVEVPAGTYEIGKDPADQFHLAPQSIQLPGFWIDQYQVTNAQYEQYMQETGAAEPVVWPGEPNHPVRGVTWDQAGAYCAWLDKRLPNETEWEAAGRGSLTGPQLYPWGTDPTAGGSASSLPDQDTYPVGTLSFNQSPFGVFDLVGNVWEWTGEPYSQVETGYRVLRGGRFGLLLDLAYRLAVTPDDTRYVKYAGFRCATDQVQ
jgi:eukaryotic-like serine/threonine-protein kinase